MENGKQKKFDFNIHPMIASHRMKMFYKRNSTTLGALKIKNPYHKLFDDKGLLLVSPM
jgi:hypothetical protein